jgi:predicted nucleotidyltransferase
VIRRDVDFSMHEIEEVCRRYQVRELAVFGSALRSDFRAASDIDLLVEFEPEAQVGFMTLSRMQRELSAILHRKVDLVPKGGLKPIIRRAVLSTAQVLYAA